MKKVKALLHIIFCVAVTAVFAQAGAAAGRNAAAAGDGDKIAVTTKLTVTSAVQNVLKQTYKSTVKGAVKNQTSETLTNIVITLNVKTNTLEKTGTLTLTIARIAANQTYTINSTADTGDNFETVVSLSATIAGGASFTLSNTVAAAPPPPSGSNNGNNGGGGNNSVGNNSGNGGVIGGVVTGVVIGLIIVCILVWYVNKKRRENEEAQARQARREALDEAVRQGTVVKVRHGRRSEYIPVAQQQPQVITVAPPQVNVTVNAPAQTTTPEKRILRCGFCGNDNYSDQLKCTACGATLRK